MRLDERGKVYNNSIGERGEILFSSNITANGLITFGGQIFTQTFTLLLSIIPNNVKTPTRTFIQSVIARQTINIGRYIEFVQSVVVRQSITRELTRTFTETIHIIPNIIRTITCTFISPIISNMVFSKVRSKIFTQSIIVRNTLTRSISRLFSVDIHIHESALKQIYLAAISVGIHIIPDFSKGYLKTFIQDIKCKVTMTKTVSKVFTLVQPIIIGINNSTGRYLVFIQSIKVKPTITWARNFRHTAAKTIVRIAKSVTGIKVGD